MYKRTENYQDYLNRLFPPEIKPGERRLSQTVTFQVTDACNLCCTYCYQINKHHHSMDFELAKRFVDMLLDADESNNPYINPTISPGIVIEFIGGEPFLEIDLIDRITDYFIEQMILRQHPWASKFMISICSNGVLYFDPKVQAYLKKHLHHLSFSISIDGNKHLHDACRIFPDGSGSYDIAIRGVDHYTKVLGGKMGSKMTLAPANIGYTFEAVENLIALGYKEVFLNCVFEKGWTLEHAKILYGELKKVTDYMLEHKLYDEIYLSIFEEKLACPKSPEEVDNWCGGTGFMISMDYKGDIYPCIRYMESSLGNGIKPIIIGNVETGIMGTKEQCSCVDCLRCITRKTQSTEECFNCPIAEGCAWCSAYNYQEFGTPDHRATYICVMHKARALANVYYWNKVYQARGSGKVFQNHVPEEWALEIISREELNLLNSLCQRESAVSLESLPAAEKNQEAK
jgi:uncharacterized protein